MNDARPPRPPKKWKMALVVWLTIYPLITVIFVVFGRQISQIHPVPLRTLGLTVVLVPLMVFFLLPFVQKIFLSWLKK